MGLALGTFFGTGFLKPGPGTYASIAALLLWFGTIHALHLTPATQSIATLIAAVAVTLIGIPAATIVARESSTRRPRGTSSSTKSPANSSPSSPFLPTGPTPP